MSFVLVTGATSDIGRAIAIDLSKDHQLVLHGRNEEALNNVRLACSNPDQHHIFCFDLSQPEALRPSLISFLNQAGVEISYVVHCAAMMKVLHMKAVDLKTTYQLFNVNLFSIIEIVSVLVNKRFNKGALRSVVFISAILARCGSTGHHLYSASKGALDGLMRSLAVELAPQVRVNSVLPGAVETKMASHLLSDPALVAKLNRDYPLGIGKPKDIAPVVRFLLSEGASWITGQEIIVDGGRTINISNT